MSILLLTLLVTLLIFPLVSSIQPIIKNNNTGNYNGLLIVSHDICSSYKIVPLELENSKKQLRHTFYEAITNSNAWGVNRIDMLIPNTKKAL